MQTSKGFSLMELLVAMAVAGIIMAFAVPGLRTFTTDNRLATQASSLISSLALARSEAIKRRQRVTVCKSADGTSCDSSAEWHQGWLVFVDPATPGTINTGELTLRQEDSLSGDSTISSVNGQLANYIAYASSGLSQGGPGPGSNDLLKFCDPSGVAKMRIVKIDAVGRVSLSTGDPSCP